MHRAPLAFGILLSLLLMTGCWTGVEKRSAESVALTPTEQYFETVLTARHLLEQQHFTEAQRVYQAALEMAGAAEVDKREIRYALLYIGFKQGATTAQMEALLNDLEDELGGGRRSHVDDYLVTYWQDVLAGNQRFDERTAKRFYFGLPGRTQLKALFEAKRYREALSLFPPDLEGANIVSEVARDMLTEAVFPGQRELLCVDTLERYPNSITYTMRVCRYLVDRSSVSLDEIRDQLESEAPHRLFWMGVLEDLAVGSTTPGGI